MYILDEILDNWNIDKPYVISEINVDNCDSSKSNAWIINRRFVLKRFTNNDYIKRSAEVTKALDLEGIPVAVPLMTKAGEDYFIKNSEYYCLYPKLAGECLRDCFDGDYLSRAKYLGQVIGRLHHAFVKCESFITCPDSNLYEDVSNWAIPIAKKFSENRAAYISDELINDYKSVFADIYNKLPRQIIHRDIHAGNLLFEKGRFTGYIDFDLSQRNMRVFDPCYMSTGILSGCIEDAGKLKQWTGIFKSIMQGYDEVCVLSSEEKMALIYVLYSIQFIFIAYFAENGYSPLAETNIRILNWIYENRNSLEVLK